METEEMENGNAEPEGKETEETENTTDGGFTEGPTGDMTNGEPKAKEQEEAGTVEAEPEEENGTPERVRKYDRFKKVDRARYDRVNDFMRKRTYVTAREWAIARLCADFRTETGVEMTLVGENLPDLVPFMEEAYTPQAVNQARSSFEDKVKKSGATFLYGAMSGFFTTEELDEMMYEVSETARFLLEVESTEVGVDTRRMSKTASAKRCARYANLARSYGMKRKNTSVPSADTSSDAQLRMRYSVSSFSCAYFGVSGVTCGERTTW
jgi:hypothetical protein